jgi:subtilisin family serine protease
VLVMLPLPAPHYRADRGYSGRYGDAAADAAQRRVASSLARDAGLTLADDWPMPLLGVHCFVMALPAGAQPQALQQALAALSHDPRVAWAQPLNEFRALAERAHDDPLYAAQPAAAAWHLASLHQAATGQRVRVAVIDSGVEARHPDLEGQLALVQDFQPRTPGAAEAHGTAIAGVIGARAGNRIGIAGVAPRARLLALRACRELGPDDTRCDSLSLAQALQAAIQQDADVINLSLSGPADTLLSRLLDVAQARGMVVVTAADRSLRDGGFPASHPGVVAVVDDAPGPVPGSAWKAPGRDVPTTLPGGRFGLVSGASYAAAHVAGLVALMRELQPLRNGQPVFVRASAGGLDACATVWRLKPSCTCGCGDNASAAAAPLPLR